MKTHWTITIFPRWKKICARYLPFLWLACFWLLTAGCETPGEQLAPGTADFIVPGTTTLDQVTKVFGEPTQTLKDGDRTLMFWKVVYWATPNQYPGSGTYGPSEDSTARGLSLIFDRENRVLAKRYSDHSFHTLFGAGAIFSGKKIDESVFDQIQPNVTTQAQALALLGEPMMESLSLGGAVVLDWAYVEGDYIGGETQLRTLRLFIDSAGIVVAVRKVNDR